MTNSIKAIIYDVDGTLVDTEPLHNQAWNVALQNHGSSLQNLSGLFIQQMAGKKPTAIATEMVNALNLEVNPEQLLNDKANIYLELVSTRLQAMPGAIDSIKRFKNYGYLLGIGTSLDKKFLENILHKLQIGKDFDVIVTGDQIKNGKPDPETYLNVLSQLNVNPEEAIVFEDAESGIKAAKAAGTWCVAVTGNQKVSQNAKLADVVINSLDEATIELVESSKFVD